MANFFAITESNNLSSVKDYKLGSPVSYKELNQLFAAINWLKVDDYLSPSKTYNGFRNINLIRVHSLPYLLPLASERPLARELKEREFLQDICGFHEDKKTNKSTVKKPRLPSRSTLWFFRDKHEPTFPEIMLDVLVSLALTAIRLNMSVPFVTRIEPFNLLDTQPYAPRFLKKALTGEVSISQKKASEALAFGHQLILPSDEIKQLIGHSVKERKRLADALGLPVKFILKSPKYPKLHLVLTPPPWLEGRNTLGKDPLITIGSANITSSYTACNIVVTRNESGREQILLSKRLAGYGANYYELPGGKRNPDDKSIKKSAIRELQEETGLELLESRPVSLRHNQFPEKPLVKSVGIIAIKFEGKLKHLEAHQNTRWEWYDLDNLPSPLFEPSKMVINDYINNAFPNLTWEDVEEPRKQPPLPFPDLETQHE